MYSGENNARFCMNEFLGICEPVSHEICSPP